MVNNGKFRVDVYGLIMIPHWIMREGGLLIYEGMTNRGMLS